TPPWAQLIIQLCSAAIYEAVVAGTTDGRNVTQPKTKGAIMYNVTEQFAEINKAGYANAVKLASLSLDKAERLTKLNLQAAKVAVEQGGEAAKTVAGSNAGEGVVAG